MTPEAQASSASDEVAPGSRRPGGLSVGAVAARLGVAPETVRSWGRRYGLTPSSRTAGGHRRFDDDDVERLTRMQQLVASGATPAAAARHVGAERAQVLFGAAAHSSARHPALSAAQSLAGSPLPEPPGGGRGGPGGRVLAVPGASRQARGLARAASRLDADGIERILERELHEHGAAAAWDDVVRPVLVAAGERWLVSGDGIEIEHLLSESVKAAYWRHRRLQQPAHPGRPVLLACFPDDIHVLPLYVLGAALAEHRVATRQLGARVPLAALVAATRRTGACAVFVWRQIATGSTAPTIVLPNSRPPVRLVVGGPGWAGTVLSGATVLASDLREAVDVLRESAVRGT